MVQKTMVYAKDLMIDFREMPSVPDHIISPNLSE